MAFCLDYIEERTESTTSRTKTYTLDAITFIVQISQSQTIPIAPSLCSESTSTLFHYTVSYIDALFFDAHIPRAWEGSSWMVNLTEVVFVPHNNILPVIWQTETTYFDL